jgi:hypothetical protein
VDEFPSDIDINRNGENGREWIGKGFDPLEGGLSRRDGIVESGNMNIHLGKFPYRCAELLLNIADTASSNQC